MRNRKIKKSICGVFTENNCCGKAWFDQDYGLIADIWVDGGSGFSVEYGYPVVIKACDYDTQK